MKWRSGPAGFGYLVALIVMALIGMPIVMLILASVAQGRPGNITGLTLDHYISVLADPKYWRVVGLTLLVACASAAVAMILGLPLAWLLARTPLAHSRLWRVLAPSPLYLSPLVVAVGWEVALNPATGYVRALTGGLFEGWGLYGPLGIILVMGMYFSTYVYLYVSPALAAIDDSTEGAALVSGARPIVVTARITLPAVLPSVLAVMILIIVLATGLLSISAVLGWPINFRLLPLEVYFALSVPPINYGLGLVMSVVTLILTTTLLLAYHRLTKDQHRYRLARGYDSMLLGRSKRIVRYGRMYLVVYLTGALVVPLGSLFAIATLNVQRVWVGFERFTRVFESKNFLTAATNTLLVAGATAVIVGALGLAIAFVLRFKLLGRLTKLLDLLVAYPTAIPGIVLGAGLLWTFLTIPGAGAIYGTVWVLVIACVITNISAVVRSLLAGADQVPAELFDAASVSGARWRNQLTRVFAPLLSRYTLETMVMSFVLASRELASIVLLWNSLTMTLPILMFSTWRDGSYGDLAAIGLIQTAATFLILGLAQFARWGVGRRREQISALQAAVGVEV